jgi:hypothetical protein
MSDNANTRNDNSMNKLNTVSKPPNVWPTNETHLSGLSLLLVIVMTGYVSCIPSGPRLLYFTGLCRRLGLRFLVIGLLTLGRHAHVVAIETGRELVLSAICSRRIFCGSVVCLFRSLLLLSSRRPLLIQFTKYHGGRSIAVYRLEKASRNDHQEWYTLAG